MVNNLLERRKHSIESRPEYGRMGLCADKEDFSLVAALESDHWPVLVPLTKLGAGYKETQITSFSIADADGSKKPLSHLRIDMGPDGGIARVRVFGRVHNSFNRGPLNALSEIDLAAVENGGLALVELNRILKFIHIQLISIFYPRLVQTSITVIRGPVNQTRLCTVRNNLSIC